MWLYKSKQARVVYVAILLLISGCGFSPLYGGKNTGLYNTIYVAEIKSTDSGLLNFNTRQKLQNSFPNSNAASADWTLEAKPIISYSYSSLDSNGFYTRGNVTIVINWRIISNIDDVVIYTNSFSESSPYDMTQNGDVSNQNRQNVINDILNSLTKKITLEALVFLAR